MMDRRLQIPLFNDNNTALKFFYGSKVFSALSALGISER